MSYLCVSYAVENELVARRFCYELTKYGFKYECVSQSTQRESRQALLSGCAMLLVLTSPEAEEAGGPASDIRMAGSCGKPCLCISLSPNHLDERFCLSGHDGDMVAIPYPAGEIDTPDEHSVMLFMHRLYILRLCRLNDCFSPTRCVDDVYGRMVTLGVKAWEGDIQAQYALGMAYAKGEGLPVLDTQAVYWIKKASDAGLADALVRMGELLLDGEGVERDPAEALRLFSTAARAGDVRGEYARGICCLYGYGLMKDPEMAVRYLKAAADRGYPQAQYRLGLLYRDGVGTEANWHLAVKYLYLAACGQRAIPLYHYSVRYGLTRGAKASPTGRRFACISMRYLRQKMWERRQVPGQPSTSEIDKLKSFCHASCRPQRKAFPEDGWLFDLDTSYDSSRYNKNRGYSHQRWDVALAQGALGRLLELGSPADDVNPSPIAAMAWYRRAMAHGHSGAMFRLGDMYRSGRGVPKNPQQAVRLFRRAADFGNVRGQFAMGVCCEQGQGLPRSLIEAVRWYEMAANAGYAPAQNNLGGCYEYGRGVAVDMLTAVAWYTKASAQGQADAACRLAICYENGRGVPESHERAFHLFEDAARRGHAYALYRLGLFYDKGITVPPQVAYAAHLYERAAREGVAEAAYALALCLGGGRGVRKNPQESFEWLRVASELGSVQGSCLLGLCYFEGHTALQNRATAMRYFRRAVKQYQAMTDKAREEMDKALPVDAKTMAEAAGEALYMLGFGCLIQDPPDISGAYDYFKKAASMERYEAMTALGDLYAYGLISASPEEMKKKSLAYYEKAAKGSQANALLSLSMMYEGHAKDCIAAGDEMGCLMWRERAWRCLARCAEKGQAYALIGMAGCAYMGNGTVQNKDTARWFLERADRRGELRGHRHAHVLKREAEEQDTQDSQNACKEAAGEGSTLAAMWLGDLYCHELQTVSSVDDAKALVGRALRAYGRAIDARLSLYDHDPYVVPARIAQRQETEVLAKAQANYRLGVLQFLYATCAEERKKGFACLAEAVLMGHATALDDMAKLYAHQRHLEAQATLHEVPLKRKARKETPDKQAISAEKKRLEDLGGSYYLTLRPIPQPFELEMTLPTPPQDCPDYMTAQVTTAMKGAALNHLGDRYFYGDGVREDPYAAVACYRRAATLTQPRGEAVEGGIVWAKYSLGYCLLEGIGVKKDAREAVRWLSEAAKYHGEAAFALAKCYEMGVGVDAMDLREALKYHRKAQKLGCVAATAYIAKLEKRLREED